MPRSQITNLQQRLAEQLIYAYSCFCSHPDVDKYRFSDRIEVFRVRNSLRPANSATKVHRGSIMLKAVMHHNRADKDYDIEEYASNTGRVCKNCEDDTSTKMSYFQRLRRIFLKFFSF